MKFFIPPKGTPIKIFHYHAPAFYLHKKTERQKVSLKRDCPVPGCWEERVVREIMES